ncbi:MAG: ACT domain-containing protein, partial [marine benthic group bacterium]|nr:ACT domain-containing protein [Gemmatimonadota bacterium]
RPDDERLRNAEAEAAEKGLEIEFQSVELGADAHPNSATFDVSRGEDRIAITGCSIGGGRIRVLEIDGFAVDLSGSLPAIVVVADDVPGTVARITGLIADRGLNVATVRVDRTGRGERALMTIETDEDVPDEVLAELAGQPWVHWIRNVHQLNA